MGEPPRIRLGADIAQRPFNLPVDHDHVAPNRSSSLEFLQQKLRRSLTRSRSSPSDGDGAGHAASNTKGPLGLNILHQPSEPRIDFVFVHGLGGGSRKTWTYSSDPGMFWPKEWLPNEVGFKHVRLQSYGYNSDWTSRKESHSTVHDFGQALLADLHNSPHLRKNGNTPIVFVAHSMGGLVVKKAYLLATRDPNYRSIARRIHAIYFLGTPHRGADSARLAKHIRQSGGYGPKAFLDDLLPGSGTLNQINDEFRHVCGDLDLWSFSEGVPTSFGIASAVVVERESAIMGLPKEHVQYIEADHRHICKFDSPISPNYVILQRAFLTTIEDAGTNIAQQRDEQRILQLKKIASLLGADRDDRTPKASLLAIQEKQQAGSCRWLTEHSAFREWVDAPVDDEEDIRPYLNELRSQHDTPRLLWLSGRPGTGKSVAAGHIVRYLQDCNLDCSYYFFRHQNKATVTVPSFLRSVAYQMAETSCEVRKALVSMVEDDVRISHHDHHMLWTSLFSERIFKADINPQFWVIDALDECSSNTLPALVSWLSKLETKVPVRIFITSRPGGQVERVLTQESAKVSKITTGQEGSLEDIELFLKARCARPGRSDHLDELVADILTKSNGIFLWASLTATKLEEAYSIEDKQSVLQEIPPEMEGFYTRIIASIADSPSADLAKCILKWTICSPDSLDVELLKDAVKSDIGRTLTASASELETITGHLVFVDKQSRIHITHQTMSAFLTTRRDGFWIDRTAAHSRIADICLKVLCGSDFTPPKVRSRGMARNAPLSKFCSYAALNFSYHLVHGSSEVDSTLIELSRFLRFNVLTWIQRMAEMDSLGALQLTARRFKTYLGRRAKYQSPVSRETQTVVAWASDIYHIVAAFHSNLLASPLSIHSIIPHLCPSRSIIRELFAKSGKQEVRITGHLEQDWNDRIACFLFPDEATAVACCDRLLAVGLARGDIKLYYVAEFGVFEPVRTLSIGKKVRHLAFNRAGSLLASSSPRKIALWDVRALRGPAHQLLWSQILDFTPSSMSFSPDESRVTVTNNQESSIVSFTAQAGRMAETVFLRASADSDSSDESNRSEIGWTPPGRILLDREQKTAALAYRNAAVFIWDLTAHPPERLGCFEKKGFEKVYSSPQTVDMIFNPVSELGLLALSHKNGDVVTCTVEDQEQTAEYTLSASLTSLAVTSDGRVLAGAAEDGAIYLFLFETLQLIYHIPGPDNQVRVLDVAFSSDNLRFFDIRGECCNVWEPLVLVPRDASDDSSSEPQSEEIVIQEPSHSQAHVFRWGEGITVIEHMPAVSSGTIDILLVGRQDGTIELCDTSTGDILDKLRLHSAFSEIQHLEMIEKQGFHLLLSVDSTNRILLTKMSVIKKGAQTQMDCLLDHRESHTIVQALLGPNAGSVLVQTESASRLMGLSGETLGETYAPTETSWARHPTNASRLIAIQADKLHVFDWARLDQLSPIRGARLVKPGGPLQQASTPWIGGGSSGCLARAIPGREFRFKDIITFEASKVSTQTDEVILRVLQAQSMHIQLLLGILRSRLYFLDNSGWICSIHLGDWDMIDHYMRHFFVPLTWRTGQDVVMKIISKSAVAFGRGEQLMIFHGFLKFEEKVTLRGGGEKGEPPCVV